MKNRGSFLFTVLALATVLLSTGASHAAGDLSAQSLAPFAGHYSGAIGKHGPLPVFGMPFEDYEMQAGYTTDISVEGGAAQIAVSKDLAGPGCDSKIGALKNMESSWGDLYAYFDFNPGKCASTVAGRTLLVKLSTEKQVPQVRLQVLKEIHTFSVPTGHPGQMRTANANVAIVGNFTK